MTQNESESENIDRPSRRRQQQRQPGTTSRADPMLYPMSSGSPPSPSPSPRPAFIVNLTRHDGIHSRSCNGKNCYAIIAMVALVVCWFICFFLLVVRGGGGTTTTTIITSSSLSSSSMVGVHDMVDKYRSTLRNKQSEQEKQQDFNQHKQNGGEHLRRSSPKTIITEPHLVSRMPNKVIATS